MNKEAACRALKHEETKCDVTTNHARLHFKLSLFKIIQEHLNQYLQILNKYSPYKYGIKKHNLNVVPLLLFTKVNILRDGIFFSLPCFMSCLSLVHLNKTLPYECVTMERRGYTSPWLHIAVATERRGYRAPWLFPSTVTSATP